MKGKATELFQYIPDFYASMSKTTINLYEVGWSHTKNGVLLAAVYQSSVLGQFG